MRQDLCFVAALSVLISLLVVAMATEEKTRPGLPAVTRKGQGPLPSLGNDQRQSSTKLGLEYVQRTIGSNNSVTAAGKGPIHMILSSSDQKKHVSKPSDPVSQEGKGQVPPDTSTVKNPSSIAALPYDPDQDHGTGRLLVAVARTLVTSTASTTTVTVLSTCHAGMLPTPVCPTGRKRKRKRASFSSANTETWLDSSIGSGELELFDKPVNRASRLILWSSSITTILFTATSTTAVPIVSASFSCSFVGITMCG